MPAKSGSWLISSGFPAGSKSPRQTRPTLPIRYELANRPEALRHPDTIALQQGKIDRALDVLEAAPPNGPLDIGHIAVACALGYLDLRFEGAWRANHPELLRWLEDFSGKTPAFEATRS